MSKTITSSEKIKISFDIPVKWLEEMDNERNKVGLSRSNWISTAIMEKLAKIKKSDDENIEK